MAERSRKPRAKPWEVPDELWERIAPLLPPHPRRHRYPGRRRRDDRLCLQGVLFVLITGTAWEHLPQELGYGSGMTCWRRLREWQEAGVWPRLHELLLAELRAAGALDLSRAAIDGTHAQAKGGLGDRAQPGRPRPARRQAPPPRRGEGRPARLERDRRQPPRRHAACAAAGSGAPDPRRPRAALAAARGALRRPGLRPPPAAARASPPWHPRPHRPQGPRARIRRGGPPLAGRADDRPHPSLQAATCLLRPHPREPPSLARHRLLSHLLASPPGDGVIMLGALS